MSFVGFVLKLGLVIPLLYTLIVDWDWVLVEIKEKVLLVALQNIRIKFLPSKDSPIKTKERIFVKSNKLK